MHKLLDRLDAALGVGRDRLLAHPAPLRRPYPQKWSPQEVIGHLVDSAIHNLIRFTEAPAHAACEIAYPLRGYDQDHLVEVNGYREVDGAALLALWRMLNARIAAVLARLSRAELDAPVELPDGTRVDVRALAEAYVAHLEDHVDQLQRQGRRGGDRAETATSSSRRTFAASPAAPSTRAADGATTPGSGEA